MTPVVVHVLLTSAYTQCERLTEDDIATQLDQANRAMYATKRLRKQALPTVTEH